MRSSTLVVVLILFFSTVLGGCSPSYSLQELKEILKEIEAEEGVVSKSTLFSRIGRPESIQMLADDVYLYYRVKEGTAQIVGNSACWTGVLPKQVPVGTPPEQPPDVIKWWMDRGGINPFSVRKEDISHTFTKKEMDQLAALAWTGVLPKRVKVEVLRDGKVAFSSEAEASSSYLGWAFKSCTVTYHLRGEEDKDKFMRLEEYGLKIPKEEEWRAGGPQYYPGHFAVRDGSGTLIGCVIHRKGEYARKRAKEQAEAAAAEFMRRYRMYEETFPQNLAKAEKEVAEYINRKVYDDFAMPAWNRYYSDWLEKNSRVVKEWLLLRGINLY